MDDSSEARGHRHRRVLEQTGLDMPIQLPPFDPSVVCTKCGYERVIVNYHPEYTDCGITFQEHLHRICMRCGAEWAETPLDRVCPKDEKTK